jgi:hypothetical protein
MLKENLLANDFMEIWNSHYYESLRTGLLEGGSCLKYCLKVNPQAVNDFRSHLIIRENKTKNICVVTG